MVMRLSNGTGGGNWTAGASWAVAVPGLGDTAQIVAGDTITIDATFQVGDDTATPALDILNGATVDWDNLGNDTCDFQGDFYVRNGGTLILDGTVNGGNVLTIQLNRSATLLAGEFGLIVEDGAVVNCDGFNKTRSWDTLSAAAAAGQPSVVTTNDNSVVWNVGDSFAVASIDVRNVAGVEADTIGAFAGGNVITKAGANYGNIHDDTVAFINLSRNVIITSFNAAFNGYILVHNTTLADFDVDWVEFSELGVNAANKYGLYFSAVAAGGTLDYCSFHDGYSGVACAQGATLNVVNCIFYLFAYAGVEGRFYHLGSVTDCAILACTSYAHRGPYTGATTERNHYANGTSTGLFLRGNQASLDDLRVYGLNFIGISVAAGGAGAGTNLWLDNNQRALQYNTAVNRYVTVNFGATKANTIDVLLVSTGVPFDNVIVEANALPAVALVTAQLGSIHIADVANNHRTYTQFGTYEKQIAVVRTGTYAMLMSPTSATDPLIATSAVPAANGVQIVVSAYLRKNVAYGAANRPFIRLSGKGMVTDTATMTDVNNVWELVVVSGTPTSDGFAVVEFVSQSAGVGAASYMDDCVMVYTAIDTGSMDYWFEGDVPPVLISTGLGAMDVWNVDPATITAAATFGTMVKSIKGLVTFVVVKT